MTKKYQRIFLLVLSIFILLLPIRIFGAPVSPEEATAVIKNFIGYKAGTLPQQLQKKDYSIETRRELRGKDNELLGYVFELDPKGYFVAAPDTKINPVIAYSYRSDFSWRETKLNQLLYLLKSDLGLRVKAVEDGVFPEPLSEDNQSDWKVFVSSDMGEMAPSGYTQWGPHFKFPAWAQVQPFNNDVPIDPDTGDRSVVGCVATAMAQIINYWQYPDSVDFTSAQDYTTNSRNISIDANTADIPNIYYSSDPSQNPSNAMVAALSYAAGVSVEMDYTSNGSLASTSDVAVALSGGSDASVEEVWGYNSATYVYNNNSSVFYSHLTEDMQQGQPSQLSITVSGQAVGHSIVADGYRSGDDYFHLNYGWGPGSYVGWYDLPDGMPANYDVVRGAVMDIQPYNQTFNVYFTYTLEDVDSANDTYTLSLEATTDSYAPPIEDLDFSWSFGDGSGATGQTVTHTFSGLGKMYDVTLTATSSDGFASYESPVLPLGGITYLATEALQESDDTELKQLESQLSWTGDSLEKIYLASTKAALKAYELADKYGITSATQLTDALSKAYEQALPLGDSLKLKQLNSLSNLFKLSTDGSDPLAEQLAGFKKLFTQDGATQQNQGTVVASLSLPQVYQEVESLASFIDSLLENLEPVVDDTSFELQFPSYDENYIALDNGDIGAVLSYVAFYKGSAEALISYSPGDPVMNNVVMEVDDYYGFTLEGTQAVADIIEDNFVSARGNGVLDLNGSGDGDADTGFEVLPDSSLTLRDGTLLVRARDNFLRAVRLLRKEVEVMPSSPGVHDPQIEWPMTMYLFGQEVTVSRTDVIGLLDDLENMLQGNTQVNIDMNFDGLVEYTTAINLASLADDPIADLKTLLPDLVTTSDPDDPLVVLPSSLDGINSNWKIEGVVDVDNETVDIAFPDTSFGGLLPDGDANKIIEVLAFGSSPSQVWTAGLSAESADLSDTGNGFGVQEGASDCFGNEDVLEPPPGPDYLSLFFSLPSSCSSSDKLSTDVRAPVDFSSEKIAWDVTVETNEPSGASIDLTWDSSSFKLPAGASATLKDLATSETVDMIAQETYSYTTQESYETRQFEITVGGQPCMTVPKTLSAGWNMFSVPGNTGECQGTNPEAVLGDDLGSNFNLYRWNSQKGGYNTYPSSSMPLTPSGGQWLHLSQDTTVDAQVKQITSDYSIHFEETGWHQIGYPFTYPTSLRDARVYCNGSTQPIDDQNCVASYVYSWAPSVGGYIIHDVDPGSSATDALHPWQGFWIKVDQAPADLILSSSGVASPASAAVVTTLTSQDSQDQYRAPPPHPLRASSEGALEVVAYNHSMTSNPLVTFVLSGEASSDVDGIRVEVQNLSGTKVYSDESDSKTLTWNTEGQANGVYLYVASVDTGGGYRQTNVGKLLILN